MIPVHGNGVRASGTGAYAWIIQREEPLLWIPKEFRPRSARHWDFQGSILAIGVNSFRMLIVDFSRHPNAVACKDAVGVNGVKRERKGSLVRGPFWTRYLRGLVMFKGIETAMSNV